MAMSCVGNDEFWRECADWLTRLELLRADHRANWETAVIADLANTLRDGVLLCNLLNKLDPGCIDSKDFNQKPAMAQFLCLRNIRLFLKTCQNVFGLRECDLFDESMLFDLTNFHQVLCTLSRLSLTPKALRVNANGFSAQIEKTEEEEEIYQSLKSVVLGDLRPTASAGNVNEPSWLQFTIPCPRPDDREEEVYDDLCYVTFSACLPEPPQAVYDRIDCYEYDDFSKSEDIYQDLCSLRHDLLGAQPPLEKRDYVIKELIDTEKNYVDVLSTIMRHYIVPLEDKMEREHHMQIFCNIKEILEIHVDFRNQLAKVQIDKTVRLSNIFMSFRDMFLIYGTFCSNLTEATNLLQDLCDKNELLNLAIIKCDNDANNGKFKLRDLLQVPMQRILKYHLLLEKLVDSTDPNHDEYKELKRAREAMLDVASYINEMARDKDQMNVLKEIARNMVWEHNSQFSIETCGRLRKDGEVKVKEHGENKPKSRYAFIFDKYMFLTKQKSNQFMFRSKLDLTEFKIDEANNRALLSHGARWTFQWQMVKFDNSAVYTMSVKSIQNKETMIKAIRDAIDNVRPRTLQMTTHRFHMYTFPKPEICYRCSKYLKGSLFQGYICQVCHIMVHKECIGGSGRCGAPPVLPPLPEATTLQNKLWFAGEKDRSEASNLLQNRKPGTFLVRIRLQNDSDRYALSLKTNTGVKHMKICSSKDGLEQKYYLSISRFFNSLEEMVINYQDISLKENFERLEDAKLEYPYRQIKSEAMRTYHSVEDNHLTFEAGEIVMVLGKDEYREGWSKGYTQNGTMGYFPSNYVTEKEEITYDAF